MKLQRYDLDAESSSMGGYVEMRPTAGYLGDVMEQKFYISDKMQELINWEEIMPLPRYAGGHDEQMEKLFKGATVIAHWNEGDWQGTVATCVKLPSGEFAIYNDFYGSCSGCDGWDGAADSDVLVLCRDLANSAKVFKNLDDVKEYLGQKEFDDYAWGKAAKFLLKEILERQQK